MKFQGKNSRKSLTSFARHLRQTLTEAEDCMWNILRGRRFIRVKFRRQVQIDRYIVDFYAPYIRLAIELDGEGHFNEAAEEHDRERTKQLEELGVTVLRFENRLLFEETNVVLRTLDQEVSRLLDKTGNPNRLRSLPWR